MVPQARAQSSAVGSPAVPGPKSTTSSPGAAPSSPGRRRGRRRTGPCRSGRGSGVACRRPRPRRRSRHGAARRRRTPAGPGPHACRPARSRCGRRRRRRPRGCDLVSASGAVTVIAGSRPRSGLRPGAGSRPYAAMPQRTRSKRLLGRSSAPPELARWRTSGRRPARSAPASASRKARSWSSLAGWRRLVGGREVRPDAGDPPHAVGLPGAGCGEELGPELGGRAAAGQAGVDLELDAGGGARHRGADLRELGQGVRRHVDVAVDRGGPVVARDREPAEDPARVAALAEPHRLSEGGDADPGRTGLPSGVRRLEHAVPVAVGLDHDHHVGAVGSHQVAQPPDVAPDRSQVHHDLGSADLLATHAAILPSRPAQSVRATRGGRRSPGAGRRRRRGR